MTSVSGKMTKDRERLEQSTFQLEGEEKEFGMERQRKDDEREGERFICGCHTFWGLLFSYFVTFCNVAFLVVVVLMVVVDDLVVVVIIPVADVVTILVAASVAM